MQQRENNRTSVQILYSIWFFGISTVKLEDSVLLGNLHHSYVIHANLSENLRFNRMPDVYLPRNATTRRGDTACICTDWSVQ